MQSRMVFWQGVRCFFGRSKEVGFVSYLVIMFVIF